jgi:putative ABC transport system ATP-binding protein
MSLAALKNVSLFFSGSSRPLIQHLSYQIEKGDFIILLGSNGSGKSSFLKLLSRQYHASAGEIDFFKRAISTYSVKEFSQLVGVLTQNSADSLFASLTLYENYLLVQKKSFHFHPAENKNQLANYLLNFNINLSKKLDLTVDQLSGGERQAFALSLRLLHPPALLLLDEHTSALDPKTSDQIMQLTQKMIHQYHITCILTTHDLDIALKYGNRIILLHNGEIHKTIDAEEKKLLTKNELINYYF